jgi:5-hydroxyisourate hydrolase
MTGLTTHILDLSRGIPATNVQIELYFQEQTLSEWKKLKTTFSNSDGRLDQPILSEEEMKIGNFELIFHIGEYFRSQHTELPDPLFLDIVPVRFGVSDTKVHYHVPLLVSPWGYQVYRGS